MTVEIAGVAGSGKSTLSRVMSSRAADCRLDRFLRLRDPRNLRYVLHSVPRLAPMLGTSLLAGRMPTREELKLLVYVTEWDRWLERRDAARCGATLIDQGPVYALARLGCVDQPIPGTEPQGDWWTWAMKVWARALDAVLWLDAPNEVLWQRVGNRSQEHEIKGGPKSVGVTFMNDYRGSYEQVLGSLEREGGPIVLRYDTSLQGPEAIASDAWRQIIQVRSARDEAC